MSDDKELIESRQVDVLDQGLNLLTLSDDHDVKRESTSSLPSELPLATSSDAARTLSTTSSSTTSSSISSSSSSSIPTAPSIQDAASKIVVVDNPEQCRDVCKILMSEKLIALDLEGIDLGRSGEICLLQVGCVDGRVFLFDIISLREEAFTKHTLKYVLENRNITKIIFDCRSDCDALCYQYEVRPQGMYDLQILFVKTACPTARFLPGMTKVLYQTLLPQDQDRISAIKVEGVGLFAPEKGGKYEVWKERPLNPLLVQYAAEDVRQLFHIYYKWNIPEKKFKQHIYNVTAKRIENTIYSPDPVSGPHRDFY